MINKELNELRNRYAERIIDNITDEDNWTAKGVIDIMKEYEHSFKLLHMQNVTTTEGKWCPECGCNKLQDDLNNNYTYLNIMCDWSGQY